MPAAAQVTLRSEMPEIPTRGHPRYKKLPSDIKARLLSTIREGNYITTAMSLVGLPLDFYDNCQLQVNKGNPYYREFMRELQKAEAESEVSLTARMLEGGKNFLPCATMLERRFRERYGRSEKRQVEVTGEIRIEVVNYAQLAKSMKKEILVNPRKRGRPSKP
jgi:hypothetical protein